MYISNFKPFVILPPTQVERYDDRYFKPIYKGKYINKRYKNIKLSKSNLNDFGIKNLDEKINGKCVNNDK